MPYCVRCGNSLAEMDRFCPSCGVSKKSGSPAPSGNSQGISETNQAPPPNVERRNDFKLLKLLGIGFGAVLGVVFLFAMLRVINPSFPVALLILFAVLATIKVIEKIIKGRRNKNNG